MLGGLWSIELGIKETDMQGAGVVVFENQRVLGGSSDYFYTGRYEVKADFRKRMRIWGINFLIIPSLSLKDGVRG